MSCREAARIYTLTNKHSQTGCFVKTNLFSMVCIESYVSGTLLTFNFQTVKFTIVGAFTNAERGSVKKIFFIF